MSNRGAIQYRPTTREFNEHKFLLPRRKGRNLRRCPPHRAVQRTSFCIPSIPSKRADDLRGLEEVSPSPGPSHRRRVQSNTLSRRFYALGRELEERRDLPRIQQFTTAAGDRENHVTNSAISRRTWPHVWKLHLQLIPETPHRKARGSFLREELEKK